MILELKHFETAREIVSRTTQLLIQAELLQTMENGRKTCQELR